MRRAAVVFLAGCHAAASPSAVCRERASHRYDPGVVTVEGGDRLIVRRIRCGGAVAEGHCRDDSPRELSFKVQTSHGPPRCERFGLDSECWWGNGPGSSHGVTPGDVDFSGTYALNGMLGGATIVEAHVGVAIARATIRVHIVLVENPGHVGSELVAQLDAPPGRGRPLHLLSPPNGTVWPTDHGDGKPPPAPRLETDANVSAAHVHIENESKSFTYDGYFASSPITLDRDVWRAIRQSTEQTEALEVRLTTIVDGAVTAPLELRWRVDHGDFYQSPEALARRDEEDARSKVEREKREQEWIRTHAYIPRDDAVALAVRYLEEQGFTGASPSGAVHYDIAEVGTEAEVLARRRGSIDPNPLGTLKKAGWWWVAFRSRTQTNPCRVRVIAVSADGSRKRMIHQDLALASFD